MQIWIISETKLNIYAHKLIWKYLTTLGIWCYWQINAMFVFRGTRQKVTDLSVFTWTLDMLSIIHGLMSFPINQAKVVENGCCKIGYL